LLKKDGRVGNGVVAGGNVGTSQRRQRRQSSLRKQQQSWLQKFIIRETPAALNRNRALDNLRLVIQLKPEMMKPYEVLATELFYGELTNRSEKQTPQPQTTHSRGLTSDNALRQRRNTAPLSTNTTSIQTTNEYLSLPELTECQEVIEQGLLEDPNNASLLKLQSELKVVMVYGRSGVHAKMMHVGSFGWS